MALHDPAQGARGDGQFSWGLSGGDTWGNQGERSLVVPKTQLGLEISTASHLSHPSTPTLVWEAKTSLASDILWTTEELWKSQMFPRQEKSPGVLPDEIQMCQVQELLHLFPPSPSDKFTSNPTTNLNAQAWGFVQRNKLLSVFPGIGPGFGSTVVLLGFLGPLRLTVDPPLHGEGGPCI